MANKYKLRITKCYLVEVVDKDGNVQERDCQIADDYCFGTKEDAINTGNRLMQWVEECDSKSIDDIESADDIFDAWNKTK